jgi:hypothetical protein
LRGFGHASATQKPTQKPVGWLAHDNVRLPFPRTLTYNERVRNGSWARLCGAGPAGLRASSSLFLRRPSCECHGRACRDGHQREVHRAGMHLGGCGVPPWRYPPSGPNHGFTAVTNMLREVIQWTYLRIGPKEAEKKTGKIWDTMCPKP